MKTLFFRLMSLLCIIITPAYADNPSTFSLNSISFHNQDLFPKLYTCDGKDQSPELEWSGIPANTQSLALIFSDLDAPSGIFYHWVLYNIPTNISKFPAAMNTLPARAIAGKNTWGKMQYNGPCPPKGATHYYVFTLYALDVKLKLPSSVDANAVLEAMQKHILEKAELSATYGRSS